MRIAFLFFLPAIFALIICTGCGDEGSEKDGVEGEKPLIPHYGYGLFPDEMGPDDISPWYPTLFDLGAKLYVEVREDHILNRAPHVSRLFHEAVEAGIPVQPVIVLPEEAGVFANEANFDRYFEAVQGMIAWIEDENLLVSWITVDMETPVQTIDRINGYLANHQFLELYLYLLSFRDPAAFAESQANYQTLVDYCHDRGLLVSNTTFPFVLDDYSDGDFSLQDVFEIPVSGVEWDEVDIMAYRTLYQGYTQIPLGSDLVYQYAKVNKEIFGDRAAMFLGLILWDGWFTGDSGFQDPGDLEGDIEATLAAGIDQIHVFYFKGIIEKDDPEAWLYPDVSDYSAPPADQYVYLLVHLAMPLLDSIL